MPLTSEQLIAAILTHARAIPNIGPTGERIESCFEVKINTGDRAIGGRFIDGKTIISALFEFPNGEHRGATFDGAAWYWHPKSIAWADV